MTQNTVRSFSFPGYLTGFVGPAFVKAPAVSAGVHVWALSRAGGARAPSTWGTAKPSITPRTSQGKLPKRCWPFLESTF